MRKWRTSIFFKPKLKKILFSDPKTWKINCLPHRIRSLIKIMLIIEHTENWNCFTNLKNRYLHTKLKKKNTISNLFSKKTFRRYTWKLRIKNKIKIESKKNTQPHSLYVGPNFRNFWPFLFLINQRSTKKFQTMVVIPMWKTKWGRKIYPE